MPPLRLRNKGQIFPEYPSHRGKKEVVLFEWRYRENNPAAERIPAALGPNSQRPQHMKSLANEGACGGHHELPPIQYPASTKVGQHQFLS